MITTKDKSDLGMSAEELPQDKLEYDQYLFEVFRNDHIENQVQRIIEYSDHQD